jgi:penicillin-binding protein 1A
MTYGQGAAAALPIFALYMNKVYADKSLPYTQEDQFDIPRDFDPCHREDDMELVDGDDANSDKQLINQIFE